MRTLATSLVFGLVAAILALSVPFPATAVAATVTYPDASAWPDQIPFAQAPSGMAFSPDGLTLYASQMGEGVIAVSSSGQISWLIRSQDYFYAVGVEPDGNLLVSLAYSPYIYRIDMTDVKANPGFYLVEGNWKTRATIVHTSSANEGGISALTVGHDGTIYYGNQDAQIRFLANGVSVPLLAQASAFYSFSGLNVLPNGGLAIVEIGAGVVYGIPAATLAAGNVPFSAFRTLATNVSSRGIAVLDNRNFYDNSGTKKQFTGQLLSAPGAPTGLTATAGDQQASLQWTASSDNGGAAVSSYTVQQSQNGSWVDVTTVQTTTATLTGLTNGTATSYRIRAVNSEGAGAPSDPVTVTPFAISPSFTSDGATLQPGDSVRLGSAVTASGAGLPTGATVSFALDAAASAFETAVVDSSGAYSLTGTVPATTSLGSHYLVVTVTPSSGAPRSMRQAVTVAPAEFTAPDASDWPNQLSLSSSTFGVSFSADGTRLYVADQGEGISAVTPSGAASQVIQSNYAFAGVASEADGNLLVTLFRDSNIYRIDMADLRAHPDSYQGGGAWKTKASVVYTSTESSYMYGLASAPDGSIYYTTAENKQINVLRGGVSTALLAESSPEAFSALGITPQSELVAISGSGTAWRIPAANLAAGNVPRSAIQTLSNVDSGYGLAFFSNGMFYTDSGLKQRFTTTPSTPTALTATEGDGQISLRWSAPTDDGGASVTDYVVQSLQGGTWVDIATVQTNTATITGTTNGAQSSYRVRAVNSQGGGSPTAAVTATPFALTPSFDSNGASLAPGAPLPLGRPVTARGSGLPVGATVSLQLDPGAAVLATGVVGPSGSYDVTAMIPATTSMGSRELTLAVSTGAGTQRSAHQQVDVVAGQPVTPDASAWPDMISMPRDTYGVAFSPDGLTLYAAQTYQGITAVSPSGDTTQIIRSTTAFKTIAAEVDGNLLVSVDGDPHIYRIDLADVIAHPVEYLRNDYWRTKATVVGTAGNGAGVTGVAAAADGAIYYTARGSRQIYVLRSGSSTPLLTAPFTADLAALTMRPDGTLIVAGDGNGFAYGISAAQVAAGDIAPADVRRVSNYVPASGIALFGNDMFYTAYGSKQRLALPPGAPTGLTATPGDGQVTLQWTAPEDDGGAAVSLYIVQALINGDWADVITSDTSETTITNLTNGTESWYRIIAVNSQGGGDPSDPVAVIPFALSPDYFTNGTALKAGASLIAGSPVTVSGSGLPVGATVTLELHSTPITLATGLVGGNGSYSLTGTIPATALIGAHNLVVTVTTASGAQVSVSQPVTIAAAPAVNVAGGTSAVSLAATGADEPAPLLFAAGLALLAGIALCLLRGSRVGVHARSRERAAGR